jgi:hypothetical protein
MSCLRKRYSATRGNALKFENFDCFLFLTAIAPWRCSVSGIETFVDFVDCLAVPIRHLCSMTKLNEYVKVAEAARFLGFSQNNSRVWAEAGRIPIIRVRRTPRS